MTDATSHEIMEIDVDPDEPLEGVPADLLRSGLQSDDRQVRQHATQVAVGLCGGDLEAVLEVLPTLIDRLDDDSRVVLVKSTLALSIVAEESPADLEDAVPRLVDLLNHELPLLRTYAARALGYASVEHPEFLLGTEGRLLEAMAREPEAVFDREQVMAQSDNTSHFETIDTANRESEQRQIAARMVAANLLVEVADLEPDRLAEHTDEFVALLDDDGPGIVQASLEILGKIAREEPDAARGAVEPACELLDDGTDAVAATAVTTLGFLSDPRAIEPLQSLAGDEDRDEDLRDLADETATFIEQATA